MVASRELQACSIRGHQRGASYYSSLDVVRILCQHEIQRRSHPGSCAPSIKSSTHPSTLLMIPRALLSSRTVGGVGERLLGCCPLSGQSATREQNSFEFTKCRLRLPSRNNTVGIPATSTGRWRVVNLPVFAVSRSQRSHIFASYGFVRSALRGGGVTTQDDSSGSDRVRSAP